MVGGKSQVPKPVNIQEHLISIGDIRHDGSVTRFAQSDHLVVLSNDLTSTFTEV